MILSLSSNKKNDIKEIQHNQTTKPLMWIQTKNNNNIQAKTITF